MYGPSAKTWKFDAAPLSCEALNGANAISALDTV